MTMHVCPKGHQSQAGDYCDECGAPIAGLRSTPSTGTPSQPLPTETPSGQPCPECGTPQGGRFCEVCGFDFLMVKLGGTPGYATPDTSDAPASGGEVPARQVPARQVPGLPVLGIRAATRRRPTPTRLRGPARNPMRGQTAARQCRISAASPHPACRNGLSRRARRPVGRSPSVPMPRITHACRRWPNQMPSRSRTRRSSRLVASRSEARRC